MMTEKTETENHPPRILLIDDDKEFTDDLIFLLDGPYQIVAVHESKKGIELLEKEKFDLVILDLVLPAFYANENEMEGIEILRIIRESRSIGISERLPVIVLTKLDKFFIIEKNSYLLANALLSKPPDITKLRKLINDLI